MSLELTAWVSIGDNKDCLYFSLALNQGMDTSVYYYATYNDANIPYHHL